jgi:hypothetical protein
MALRVTRQFGEALGAGEGSLRVTRQFGEVLGRGEGKLRVTRQYIEVLALAFQTHEKSLTTNMSITDNAHVPERHERLEDVLSLTERVPATFVEDLLDNLGVTQDASRTLPYSLESELDLDDPFVYLLNVGEHTSLHETLSFTQDIDFESGLFNVMETIMDMSDSVNEIGPRYQTVWTRIHFHQYMPSKFARAESTINLVDWTGRDYEEEASTTMSLSHDMWRSSTPTTAMSLVQSLDWGKTKGIPAQYLNLEHAIDLHGDWARAMMNDLGIGHSLTYYLPDPCDTKAYTPFVGESTVSDSPAAPDTDLPFSQGLPEGERFLLLHPALGESTDVVELRAPNLDNRERQSFTRINRETRGGKLSVFADPDWPKISTLVLSFSGLTKTEVEEVHNFIQEHLGEEIGIIDWEGHQWAGVITTPNERAAQDGKHGFTLTFEFEGVLVEEMPSGSRMSVVDGFTHFFHKARSLSDAISWNHFPQIWRELPRSFEDELELTQEVEETVESP